MKELITIYIHISIDAYVYMSIQCQYLHIIQHVQAFMSSIYQEQTKVNPYKYM